MSNILLSCLLQSSIGNVKTLRSKLQARRVTLSEAIEKENLFLQGSERLASLSSDPRTKDQASLQKDFAESKIKTLQAELTKINSSLHAYQAERCVHVCVCVRVHVWVCVPVPEGSIELVCPHFRG